MERAQNIDEFPLVWRWTSPGHNMFPRDVLGKLRPLSQDVALELNTSGTRYVPASSVKFSASDDEETRQWLNTSGVPSQLVSVAWNCSTALALPWDIFIEYWNDFCYPSSDDADMFLEDGRIFLRWNHDELFEFYPNAF